MEGQIARRYKNVLVAFQEKIEGAGGKLAGEFDVELENAVIEVTTGQGNKKVAQVKDMATLTAKQIVVYGPEITNKARIRALQEAGALFAQTEEELDAIVKGLHP